MTFSPATDSRWKTRPPEATVLAPFRPDPGGGGHEEGDGLPFHAVGHEGRVVVAEGDEPPALQPVELLLTRPDWILGQLQVEGHAPLEPAGDHLGPLGSHLQGELAARVAEVRVRAERGEGRGRSGRLRRRSGQPERGRHEHRGQAGGQRGPEAGRPPRGSRLDQGVHAVAQGGGHHVEGQGTPHRLHDLSLLGEAMPTGVAPGHVGFESVPLLSRELAVHVRGDQAPEALAAHDPSPFPFERLRFRRARARASRLMTVPAGQPTIPATSL